MLIFCQSALHVRGQLLEIDVCNPDQGSRSARNDAEIEFRTFVIQTYEELYAMEARRILGKPSISLFCRLDIGVLIDKDDRAHYFVNEVERTQTTSMWSNRQNAQSPRIPARMLGHTFAQSFYEWMLNMHNPYTVV